MIIKDEVCSKTRIIQEEFEDWASQSIFIKSIFFFIEKKLVSIETEHIGY